MLQHLKNSETWRDLPVNMISVLDEMDSVVRCIELGEEDYLPKPFDPMLLGNRLVDFLGKIAVAKFRNRWLRSNLLGVVRGVHAAGNAVAGVVDEMVGDHGDLEDVLDTTLTQLAPEHGPKFGAVIGPEAGTPDQPGED